MSEFIRVDRQGGVAPEDSAARTRLAGLAGRFYLAPTSSDLLLGVRAPCAGGQASSPRVVLAGDVGGVPLADMVAFINQSRISGILRVVSPLGERAIVFKSGEVRGAASDDPADRLGEIAVRLGLLQRAQLDSVLAAKPPPNRIGRLLVEAGFLKSHDLWRCMQHQVSEIFHSILLTPEGVFMLIDQQIEEKGTLSINTQGLLMDAIRRIDEMKEFRKRLPSSRAYLVRRKPAPQGLSDTERTIFDLCTGERTVAEVAQLARLSEFDATKILHHLIETGLIAASPTAQSAPSQQAESSPEEVARVFNFVFREILGEVSRISRVFNFVFREILGEVSRIGMGTEMLAAANGALVGQAAKHGFLNGIAFQADGMLPVTHLLQNAASLGLPPTETARTLYAGLSEVMFFMLFETGELLDQKADEDLSRRVKELLGTIEGAA